jgi:predicted HTH domain antitoxin
MGLQILPTNIGGISTTSLASGPLSSLFNNKNQIQNLIFPADLASNPAMGHAVIIQAYDYTTGLGTAATNLVNTVSSNITNGSVTGLFDSLLSLGKNALTAPSYTPQRKGNPLASVSLFLPENLSVNYNSQYSDISITEELGLLGMAGSAISDYSKGQLKDQITTYGVGGAAAIVDSKLGAGIGQGIGALAAQGAGVFINPQMQLLYKGVGLREFQLEFIMTPKSPDEAKVVQNICDTLTFYSLPGISGAQSGKSGQFLTPPQIFSIQFKFLGQSTILGKLSNILTSALNNSGLGFLTQSNTGVISNANPAKLFTINDCVLENVSVNYAPNGWSAYKDGYPVQTSLSLQFKETTMITKDQFKGSQVAANYSNQQQVNSTLSPGESVVNK